MHPYQVRTFEASCRALHPVIDRTQSPSRVSQTQRAVPCIHQSTEVPVITDRVFEVSCSTLHQLIDTTQSSTSRMFNIVPRLASTDHQNPIIDKPIAQTPRSVSYPLIDITQTTNRLFHASFRTSIRTSSSCNINMVWLVEAQFGSTICC